MSGAQNSNGAFKLVGNPSTEEPNGIGLKRGDDAFRAFIKDELERMYAGGEWASAYAATLGKVGWKNADATAGRLLCHGRPCDYGSPVDSPRRIFPPG